MSRKKDVEQIIRELFRQYYNASAGESFPLKEAWPHPVGSIEFGTFRGDGSYYIMSEEGIMHAQDIGKRYWAERNEDEIERDETLGVTEVNYVEWVVIELYNLISN